MAYDDKSGDQDRPKRGRSGDGPRGHSSGGGDRRDGSRRNDDRRGGGRSQGRSYGRSDRFGQRSTNRDGADGGRRSGRAKQTPRFAGQRSGGKMGDRRGGHSKKQRTHQAEYRSPDPNEPVIPAGVVAEELGEDALRTLDTLAGANREIVARHLVMAGQLLEVDPDTAYQHAQAAVKRAGRVDVVREAAALTAYATGRYEEALREVRAVRRMRGDESLRAIEADSERGLGRPEKALEVIEAADTKAMPLADQIEVVLVAAGARSDLGQAELGLLLVEDALAAVPAQQTEGRARLMSFQADLMRSLGREEDAAAVEAAMPVPEEVMEITDLGEILDADVDHSRTPLRGTQTPLVESHDSVLLDLDGVCYEGTNPIDHAAVVLNELDGAGTKLAYVTNNASRSVGQVAEKLASFDIPANPDHINTAAMDAMRMISAELEPGVKVLVVGSKALEDLVADTGFVPVRTAVEDVAAVLQGYDASIGWAELSEAAYAISNGARFYATNLDTTLPTERGLALGNGSLVAAVSRATNRRAEASGKPHPEIVLRAAEMVQAETPLAVGDRLDTDIAAAVAARVPAMHVLTGVSRAADVIAAKRGQRPAYLALDLRGLQQEHPQPKHHRDGTWTAGVSQPVSFTRWGSLVVDGIELRSDGDPITINLDTYRAAAAAGWELIDNDRSLHLPQITVVDNDDLTGIITGPNYEPEPEPDVEETEAANPADEDAEAPLVVPVEDFDGIAEVADALADEAIAEEIAEVEEEAEEITAEAAQDAASDE